MGRQRLLVGGRLGTIVRGILLRWTRGSTGSICSSSPYLGLETTSVSAHFFFISFFSFFSSISLAILNECDEG